MKYIEENNYLRREMIYHRKGKTATSVGMKIGKDCIWLVDLFTFVTFNSLFWFLAHGLGLLESIYIVFVRVCRDYAENLLWLIRFSGLLVTTRINWVWYSWVIRIHLARFHLISLYAQKTWPGDLAMQACIYLLIITWNVTNVSIRVKFYL